VGRVRAKTGTLDGVASLSGFVTPGTPFPRSISLSEPLVFSAIYNGSDSSTGTALLDAAAIALASYPQVPPLSTVGPQP